MLGFGKQESDLINLSKLDTERSSLIDGNVTAGHTTSNHMDTND
jgi:hypothetical protein